MNLEKYVPYFHDGLVLDIQFVYDCLEFSMVSAQISKEEMLDNIPLSPDGEIQGKLHLEGLKNFFINKEPFSGLLQMQGRECEIFDLTISGNKLVLLLSWVYRGKEVDFNAIEIEAETIYWEPIPDLTSDFLELEGAPPDFRNNKEIALIAVKKNGSVLQYFSEKLRDDLEIVVAAVRNEPSALMFASQRLKDNKNVIIEAIN